MVECKACLKDLNESLFRKDYNNLSKVKTICKDCEKKLINSQERERKQKEYYDSNKERIKLVRLEYNRVKQSKKRIEQEREERLLKAKQEREYNLLMRATS